MPVTRSDIITKFEQLYLPGTHVSYTFTADGDGNVTRNEIQIPNEISPETRTILEFLVDAILDQVHAQGIAMGESTAKKLDVDPSL